MQDFAQEFALALQRLMALDPDLMEIILLSLRVSLTSCILSCILGMMIGSVLAVTRFSGKQAVLVCIGALMGLPPVVVGLFVYLLLSRAGPLGWLGLLYSPTAMIIAQTILITPIVAALSRQVLEDLHNEYREQFQSLALSVWSRTKAILWDGRYSLITVALAAFGRSVSEVGAVIIVGGNIEHLTRVMTTAIALETSKGNLSLALALGVVLLAIALVVNAIVSSFRLSAARFGYA
jgi:tungstate transport system permease protein